MATIQVRNVPDDVARAWKVRAASAGQSLQEFMLAHLKAEITQPTIDELIDELEGRQSREVALDRHTIVETISRQREERVEQITSSVDGEAT